MELWLWEHIWDQMRMNIRSIPNICLSTVRLGDGGEGEREER